MIFPALLVRMNRKDKPEHYDMSFMIVAGMFDHSVPLLCLLVEFSYNCTPFIWRHFATTGVLAVMYMIFNAVFSLFIGQIYPLIDWRSTVGIVTPLVVLVLALALQACLVNCTKKRLSRFKKDKAIVQLDKIYEQILVENQLK